MRDKNLMKIEAKEDARILKERRKRVGIHYATLKNSPRLQGALKALKQAGKNGLTTFQWLIKGKITNAGTAKRELIENGVDVRCEEVKTGDPRKRLFRYSLGAGK